MSEKPKNDEKEASLKYIDALDLDIEDVYNNNIILSTSKASGVGDSPDLISDETPPLAILSATSNSDIYLLETNNTITRRTISEGERTKMAAIPPEESSLPKNPISVAGETSQNNTESVVGKREAAEAECTGESSAHNAAAVVLPSASFTILEDKNIPLGPLSSSHHAEMTTFNDNQKGENFPLIVEHEQGNDMGETSLTLSGSDIFSEPPSTTAHFLETPEQITKHAIKTEDEVPSSSTSNAKRGCGNIEEGESAGESGAVSAPEVEQQTETGAATDIKSIHIDESYDAGELLSQQQEECPQQSSHNSKNEDDEDFSDSTEKITIPAPTSPAVAGTKKKGLSSNMPSSSSPSRKKPDLSSERKSRKVAKENSCPNKGKRKQSGGSSTSASRNSGKSKSPIRIVEVYDHNNTVEIKSSTKPTTKPASPYQCTVFPVEKVKGPRTSVRVYPNQCRILDKALKSGLEREKKALVEALTEYYNTSDCPHGECNGSSGSTGFTSICRTSVDESLITNGSQRETYMSWIIKEKHREGMETKGNFWNPLENVFRKNVYTQASSNPSNTETAEASTIVDPDEQNDNIPLETKERNEIRLAARTMYQSLKSLQKAIHLSDLLCFRNNGPEAPLGESLAQPRFQQFMDSENEIELLENVVALLGDAKDDVQAYLKSLEKANLVTDSATGLTKIETLNHNNEIEDDNNDDGNADGGKAELAEGRSLQQIVPFTCPSCQSRMDLQISNPPSSRERVIPNVYAVVTEKGKLTINTYFNSETKSLVKTALCDGHLHEVHFSFPDPMGCAQGITYAKSEYLGRPSYVGLERLLVTLYLTARHIHTRVCCSGVWIRRAEKHLTESVTSYLQNQYKPTTEMGWLRLYLMDRKLKKINVFSGVVSNLTEELESAVSKLHFSMLKARMLLNMRLREPEMPGFSTTSSGCSSWDDIKSELSGSDVGDLNSPKARYSHTEYYEVDEKDSVEHLYEKLKSGMIDRNRNVPEENDIPVNILLDIVARATTDIDRLGNLGSQYKSTLSLPWKSSKLTLSNMGNMFSQLGFSKEIHFNTLFATFLACVDKLSLFAEFLCEEKVEARIRVHKMCLKIIQKLYELRSHLRNLKDRSEKLARNSYMRIKEINEIKRLRKLKKEDKYINEKIEFVGGSDSSLRATMFEYM